LLVLVGKGLSLHINPLYFLFVLVVRGSASALYKAFFISHLMKKKLNMKKPKRNFLYNTCPTIIVFIALYFLYGRAPYHFAKEMERMLTWVFVTYMIIYRCLRAVLS
jgi:hypothetical protein